MTPDEFRDAIAKGLGRVIQHLRTHPSAPYLDIIRDACTRNLAYDSACEGTRGSYLFELLKLSGHIDNLSLQVIETLRTSQDYFDLEQAFDLARHLASDGNDAAHAAVRERFGTFRENPYAGLDELITLDGTAGLQRAAEHFGQQILAGECCAVDEFLIQTARTHLGQNVRENLLEPLAGAKPAVRACLDAIDAQAGRRDSGPGCLAGTSYAELKRELDAADGNLGMRGRAWAHAASENEATAAAQDLLAETRPTFLLSYLRMFFDRPFPLALDRLTELAVSEDKRLSHAAIFALSAIQSPAVRRFGLDLLQRRNRLKNVLRLFRRNFEPGDQLIFMESLSIAIEDEEVRHSIGLDLRSVFQNRNTPECRDPMLWVYENTPCALCRHGAVNIMLGAKVPPEPLLRECLDDCSLETRKVARGALGDD